MTRYNVALFLSVPGFFPLRVSLLAIFFSPSASFPATFVHEALEYRDSHWLR